MFVNRRVFAFVSLALPVIIFLFPIPLSANFVSGIVIAEIMYDFSGTDANHEWVELYNASSQEIDLTGWKFNDGSNHVLNIPPKNSGQGSMIMPASAYAILADDATTFLADHPSFSGTVIDTVASLNNTTATLTLFDKDNNEVSSLTYSKEWGANGNRKSLEKINLGAADNQNNWKESSIDGGTPGLPNSVSGETNQEQPIETSSSSMPLSPAPSNQPPKAEAGPDVIALINQEITFDGSKSQDPQKKSLTYFWNFGDGSTSDKQQSNHLYKYPGSYIASLTVNNGEKSSDDTLIITIYSDSIIISEFIPNPTGNDKNNEWIELYNSSLQTADLSKWQISTQNSKVKPFIFPDNSLIAGHQHIILTADIAKISLNNNEGSLRLSFPNSQVAQEIKYSKAKENQSIALASSGQYLWTTSPTPGTANVITSAVKTTETNSPTPFTAQENSSEQQNIIPANAYQPQNPTEGTFVTAGQIAENASDNPQNNTLSPLENKIEDNSSPPPEQRNDQQEKSASLFNKLSSPAVLISLIILFGLASGLGLMKLKRKIRRVP
jgi:hypothetical protein